MGVAAQRTAANPVAPAKFDNFAQWQAIVVDFKFKLILFALNASSGKWSKIGYGGK
jgi:hypothetical protein